MAKRMTLRPALATLGALVVTALSAAGCVSMPAGGPVQSYPVTQQGADAQAQPFIQVQPQAPRPGWNPTQVVQGFLLAAESFGTYSGVAQQYLTPTEQKTWKTNWSAAVYKSGPQVMAPTYPSTDKNPTTATVQVNGTLQASLSGNGSYVVPSASSQGAASAEQGTFQFALQRAKGGQWRISQAPTVLLLTSNAFQNDYQLRNLYFFDPTGKYLVPDPVYVPLGASAELLVNGLVRDLNTQPGDWLKGPTHTAFPAGTKVSSVQLAGGVTAVINLTGTAITKASSPVMEQIWAQLMWTLGAVQGGPNGQAAQSVEILRNGKPWTPPASNAVQPAPMYHPALSTSSKFYYVDSAGYLNSRPTTLGAATRLAKIGTGYTQLAVSPDGKYVAALLGSTPHGSTLYAGLIGSKLVNRGTGYLAVSWDASDDLWASAGNGIVMFRGSTRTLQPLGPMLPVQVTSTSYVPAPPYSLLKVAPDGVRVAIVQTGTTQNTLTFGAISGQQGPNPQISLSTVQETPQTPLQGAPYNANFKALAWYDADHVITLAIPGPAVTEYPVSGGNTTAIPTDSDMESITVSYRQPLIAGLSNGQMASNPATNPSFSGSWTPIQDTDGAPTSGSAPVYPG